MDAAGNAAAERARRRRGFSLIELIAVMLVMAVISVVAVPAISGTKTARTRAATLQLTRDLTFARQRAAATGTTTWVKFDVAASTYTVMAESGPSAGRATAATITDPGMNQAMIVRLNSDVSVGVTLAGTTLGNNEVGFDRLGRPLITAGTLLASAGEVTLSGGASVSIEPVSGLARATLP